MKHSAFSRRPASSRSSRLPGGGLAPYHSVATSCHSCSLASPTSRCAMSEYAFMSERTRIVHVSPAGLGAQTTPGAIDWYRSASGHSARQPTASSSLAPPSPTARRTSRWKRLRASRTLPSGQVVAKCSQPGALTVAWHRTHVPSSHTAVRGGMSYSARRSRRALRHGNDERFTSDGIVPGSASHPFSTPSSAWRPRGPRPRSSPDGCRRVPGRTRFSASSSSVCVRGAARSRNAARASSLASPLSHAGSEAGRGSALRNSSA
jgi:hypothetical protein